MSLFKSVKIDSGNSAGDPFGRHAANLDVEAGIAWQELA